MLPKAKHIGGVPDAIHEATLSSASVVNSIVSAPTNGRCPSHSVHSSASPGKHASSYAWISSAARFASRCEEGPVDLGRPSCARCVSSTLFVARQYPQSKALIAEADIRGGRIGTVCPFGRIGIQ